MAWHKISTFFANSEKLPYDGMVENIFHVSKKLPLLIKKKIRHNLLEGKDIQEISF